MTSWKKKNPPDPKNSSGPVPEIAPGTIDQTDTHIISAGPQMEIRDPVHESVDGDLEPPTINQPSVSSVDISQNQFEIKVIEAISTVFDPEIPVNIYELGLIYNIDINGMNDVGIDMTLTSPACPVAGTLPGDVERVVQTVEGVGGVKVELIWEPAWSPDRMSEAAKLELGFM